MGPTRRTRGALLAALAVVAALVGAVAPAADAGAPGPTVSVDGRTAFATIVQDCFDGTTTLPVQGGTFTIARTGDLLAPLTVDVTSGGTAVAGTDYEALPAQVILPAGVATAELQVRPLTVTSNRFVTLAIAPSPDYAVGDPATSDVGLEFSIQHTGCLYETDLVEAIGVGGTPRDLDVEAYFAGQLGPGATFAIDGDVPPGLSLAADGTWSGAATTPGAYDLTPVWCQDRGCFDDLQVRILVEGAGSSAPSSAPAPPAAPVVAEPSLTG
ncbi:MAG: hypothetical protein KDA98_07930 [Acidimicrobiales bacterium]|nr:hypothetical protein [Acidimicrobiales bacterium]